MLTALPAALVSLLFVLPAFAQSTSSNDLFRAIALQVPKPKQPDNPICCLKPMTPSEPVDDGILLSFEEWKAKQFGIQMSAPPTKAEDKEASNHEAPAGGGEAQFAGDAGNVSDTVVSPMVNTGSAGSVESAHATPDYTDFSLYLNMIPTTDRFNYASLDCSARVHTSHRSAKSATSILSSKRDRYMLSPCDTKEQQFVVVELCDDIRIDTVQLANFEFFSGVFKDFTVRVSDRYPANPADLDAWTFAGSYRAKNIRGVQTFHPPASLRDFVRFIRIDFHSHYGNEFYCPVSLLRVYGLTHLEEWKRDIWESEGKAKQAELQKKKQLPILTESAPIPSIVPKIPGPVSDSRNKPQPSTEEVSTPPITAHNPNYFSTERAHAPPFSSVAGSSSSISTITTGQMPSSTSTTKVEAPPSQIQLLSTYSNNMNESQRHFTDTYVTTSIVPPPIPSQSTTQDNISMPEKGNTTQDIPPSSSSLTSQSSSVPHSHSETSTIVVSTTSPSVAIIPVPPLPPVTKGGESIYRTILNRLTEVEVNQTLYMRYIEQQNMAIRDVIKRLGEDVGRLEGITRAQAMNYQRNLDSWQRQRSQLESEYVELVLRVEHLSEEIVLEKRLGVAQLCLLLAVLVFMGLTRGSRAEALIDHSSSRLNRSVREWGQRHLKLSGNWTGRFKGKNLEIQTGRRTSPSTSRNASPTRTPRTFVRPKPLSVKTYPPKPFSRSLNDDDDNKIDFPSTSSGSNILLDSVNVNTAPVGAEYFNRPRTISNPRSRLPSLRSTPANRRIHHQRPVTPVSSSFRPQLLQRSNSHGGPGLPQSASWGAVSVPKSAKRWARSAHLHEVKTLGPLISASARRSRKKSGENISPLTRHDRSQDRTPRELEFQRENHDFFSSSTRDENGKKSTVTYEGSLLFKADESAAASTVDEGDVWIDTDSIDGSEIDVAQPRNLTSLIQLPS